MDKEKVLSLAKLARIDLKDDEAESLSSEFGAILDYVGEVKGVTDNRQSTTDNATADNPLHNVFREDNNPHETGLYTEALLGQAPMKEGNYIKVKKIL